jgi:Protein of unknown function (DUF2844)
MTHKLKVVHNGPSGMNIRDALRRALLAAGLLWVSVAHATLGGDGASVSADATAMHGTVLVQADGPVRILEITVDNGMRVRELVDATGLVFGVTWRGPAPPDLAQLLGTYYLQFTTALSSLAAPGRQREVHVGMIDLVVDSAGHLRAYAGRAYIPDRVPPGMAATTIR